MIVTITLSGLGANLGPNFNLTADVGVVSPNTATKTELLAGKQVTVDNSATSVTVTSTGACTNSTTISIGGQTTTTTTSAPTQFTIGFSVSTAFQSCTNRTIDPRIVYAATGAVLANGVALYYDQQLTSPVDVGFYSDGTNWYRVTGGLGIISSNGSCATTSTTTTTGAPTTTTSTSTSTSTTTAAPTSTTTTTLAPATFSLRYSTISGGHSCYQSATTYYAENGSLLQDGTIIYTNGGLTILAPAGWYSDGTNYWYVSPTCFEYDVTNGGASPVNIQFRDCDGVVTLLTIAAGATENVCAQQFDELNGCTTLNKGVGICQITTNGILTNQTICPATTTSTSTSTSTSTTSTSTSTSTSTTQAPTTSTSTSTSTTSTSTTSTTTQPGSTTTSTSSTSTSTTSTTTGAVTTHLRSVTPQNSAANACAQSTPNNIYTPASTSTMAVNDVLYSDIGLTTLFNGNSQWYKIIWKGAVGTDDVYAVQINSSGVVLAWEYCPSTTTTTTSTSTSTTTTAAPTTTSTSTSSTSTSTSTTTSGPGLVVSNGAVTCTNDKGDFATTISGGSGTYSWIAIDTTQANAISAVNGVGGSRYAVSSNPYNWTNIANGTWYVAVKDSLDNVSYSTVVVSCSTTTTSTSTSTTTSTTTAAPPPPPSFNPITYGYDASDPDQACTNYEIAVVVTKYNNNDDASANGVIIWNNSNGTGVPTDGYYARGGNVWYSTGGVLGSQAVCYGGPTTTTTTAAPTTTSTSTSTSTTTTTTAGPGLSVSNGTVTCSGTNGSFTTTASGGSGTYSWIAIDTTQANAISAVNGGGGTRYAMVGNTRLWSTIGNGTWYVAVKDSLGAVSYSSVVISCSTTSTSTSTSTTTTTTAASSGPFNLDWSHGINYGTGLSTLLINKNGSQVVNSTTNGNGTITGIYSSDVITYSLVSSSPNFNRSAIIVTDADETYDTLIDCNLYMSNVSNTVGIQLNDNSALSAAADDYIDQCP